MGRVEGKIALITGAALGLGEASARMLAREGASVVLTDIKEGEGQAAAAAIAQAGGRAVYMHHDVSKEEEWIDVIRRTIAEFGRLDVLVNNAGVGVGSPPEEQTLEQWRWLMSINLDGGFLGTKHAIRTMKPIPPRGGSIINLSSIEGPLGDPNLGAYNASKGGVRLYRNRSPSVAPRRV